jgi:hypothetical protein
VKREYLLRVADPKNSSYIKAARIVAGIFVNAAMAAYVPPEALDPQMVTDMRRPPTSRAVLAATGPESQIKKNENMWYGTYLR